jgi:transcriptional regulator
MYIPAAFRESRIDVLHALIVENPFAALVSRTEGGLFATHLPFLLDAARGPYGTLLGHMARANPHWQSFRAASVDGVESLVLFQGPHAYISPRWYISQPSVPTWNYSAVHAYGFPSVLEDPRRVRALLEATIATFEVGAADPWSIGRVSEDYAVNMIRGIVAFELPISRLEGKQKLSQNRSDADTASAAAGLQEQGEPLGVAVAEQMQHHRNR